MIGRFVADSIAPLNTDFICFQGIVPTLLRNVLAGGTYFMSFELMRIARAEKHGVQVKDLPVFETFVCGTIM